MAMWEKCPSRRAAHAMLVSAGQALHAVRLQVERQTHLPANRQEAWQGLKVLVPEDQWHQYSPIFAALESIYRW